MSDADLLSYEGCNFFRLRLTYSILSGRPVQITNIRSSESDPGIKDYESKVIAVLERVTNGTKIEINSTGTRIYFKPGLITGGVFTFDCGLERSVSYYLEPLILLSPFCKRPICVKLRGITNAPGELSVDALKSTWISVYNKFVLNDERLELKIISRGLKPNGGGIISFVAPAIKILRSIQMVKSGRVSKIRGQAYVTKVSPTLAYRMVESAKKTLHGYIADVYITVDHRKGDTGGKSPGYGLFLTAETTEGVVYHGESMSIPKGEDGDPVVPEDVGVAAAKALLNQIDIGGAVDISAQGLTATFITLCPNDVSNVLFGPLTIYGMHSLRLLRDFFEMEFKIEDCSCSQGVEKEGCRTGRSGKIVITGLGIGFTNLNKNVL